jgi:hypothetical protein
MGLREVLIGLRLWPFKPNGHDLMSSKTRVVESRLAGNTLHREPKAVPELIRRDRGAECEEVDAR